jgi:hypothetical protein
MNTLDTNSKTRGPGAAVALRAGVASIALLYCVALPAMSQALPHFEMHAAGDAPGSEQIADGDYAAAVDMIASARQSSNSALTMSRLTNLCVAYTMTRQLAAAVPSCDQAVELASTRMRIGETKLQRNDRLAWVHANRAVALWLVGNREAAETDLAAAMSYAPRDALVKANAAAIAARRETVTALARD